VFPDLYPVKLPPGLYRNGTRYQSANRWYDANLIRFQGGPGYDYRIQPWGGWRQALNSSGGQVDALTGVARGLHAWSSDSGSVKIAIGTHKRAYVLIDGVMTNITPTGFVEGDESTSIVGGGGFGSGSYGSGAYGIGSILGALDDADTWSLDNFGDFLAGSFTEDGKIYIWDGNIANKFVQAAGSPTSCAGLVVTPERFLVALTPGGNKRKVQWADQETTTVWTPAATNKAGSFELATSGRLRCGARTSRETLLMTDADVWAMTFIGGTLVYSFRQVGDKCGIVGPLAKVVLDTRAFWMGAGNFYGYDGVVNPIPCDVADYVFNDINKQQLAKVCAMSFTEFGEVVWFYPSAASTEIDRYAVYNYRERHWNAGQLLRTCGFDASAAPYPILCELARSAQGTLTSTGTNVANNDTVTIGSKTYTFQTALTNVDGNVKIAATAALSLVNLYNAINLSGVAGTDYATLMTIHPTVAAADKTATTLIVHAKTSGTSGNVLATTETSAQLAWGAVTLAGGGNTSTGYPVANVLEHEVADDRGTAVPYVESGPYEMADGNRTVAIKRLVPDEKTQGDVQFYIYTSTWPNDTEVLNGPYPAANPVDVRLKAKLIRLRIQQVRATDWRVGQLRVALKEGSRR
jgi:hypothetical protein